jgi:hypothetical protein
LKGDHLRIISAKFGWHILRDFLWTLNFYRFWPIMQIRKKGGWNFKKSSVKLLSQSQPDFAEMILWWSPFKIVSVSAVLYPRWPFFLICIIGQNRQKFKVYKKNP